MSNFKIGIFNLPEPMSNLEGVRYAHEAGFAAFEPFPQRDLAQPDRETAIRIRDEANRLGVALPCLSMLANLTGEGRFSEIERLKAYAELAALMEIPLLHHTIYPPLKPEDVRSADELAEEAASAAREVYDYAQKLGVRCIYEDQGLAFNGIEGFGKFLETLDRPAGVVLDLGNVAFVGEKPAAFAKKYLDRIVHVHVKDYLINRDVPAQYLLADGTKIAPTALGKGDMAIAGALEIVMNSGYKGWFMLENDRPNGGKAGQADDARILETMLERFK